LLVGLLASTTLSLGCSVLGPRPDTSRYFLLRSLAEPSSSPLSDLVIGLGPVTLPDYLDGYEMLELVGPYELRYSTENRWVEPLGVQIRRTLSENIQSLTRPDALVLHPWFSTDGVGLQVEVAFDAIERDAAGVWRGSAEWVIRDPATKVPLERSDFSFQVGQDSISPDRLAEGISSELERMSVEIAAAVRRQYPVG